MNFRKIVLASAIAGVLAGCGADDQAYKLSERDSREMEIKDLKDGRWFYVPTTGAAPRFALNQFPFLQGMGRYVELCFTETGLEVRSFDKNNPDSSYPKDENNYCAEQGVVGSDDLVNFPVVLKIPGDFAAYRCAEDAYGDCTNQEEVNTDKSLDFIKKTHFTPKPEKLLVSEFNLDDLYGLKDGITEQGEAKVISWDFDPENGVLNFELERTFQVDLGNLSAYIDFGTRSGIEDALPDGSFKTRFYYSLVHESVVASENYQPVMYPVGDENDIGFFTTRSKKLNPITNKYDRDVVYLNRFNPDNGTIKYHLTDNFFEDKNKLFLDATIKTIGKMNQALSLFGNDAGKPAIEIVNAAAPAGVHPGDLRYNIINLVDEPLANGLLGYGPSVANPMTGEIIKAHVNQYSGVARTGVPYYWDNLARFYNRNQLELDGLPALQDRQDSTPQESEVESRVNQLSTLAALAKMPDTQEIAPTLSELEATSEQAPLLAPTILTKNFSDDMDFNDVVVAEENRLSFWSENNAYPIEASWVSSTSKAMLDNLEFDDERYFDIKVDDNGLEISRDLKRWRYLPKDLKQEAADAITVATYSNTLVHEIGHNVGLRHNFKGSNDKENYYTLEQAHALGLNNIPAYSSTMDYAPSMLDETPTWGLYDIAAFKFGYGRKVETIQDSALTMPASVGDPGDTGSEEEKATYQQYLAAQQEYEQSFANRFGNNASNDTLMVCSEVMVLESEQTGKSLYNCDFSRFDVAALSDDPQDFAKTRYGVMYYLDNVHDIERKDYGFCTDGNVSLNSDCNRFDEGTSLDEIVTYEWQRYLDSYDSRNLAEYSANGLSAGNYPNYIIRRYREMSSIRDKMEDLERIDDIYTNRGMTASTDKPGDFLLRLADNDTYCTTPDADTNFWFCDYANGAKKSAAYFLDVLATPEYQCVIENDEGDQKVISFGQLLDNNSHLLPDNYDLIDADCFDGQAAIFIESADTGYQAVAETKNGRFLNSIGSLDPDYPWSNSLSVLGTWPDKALASYFLARRFSNRFTDEVSFASLLDMPGVQEQYEDIIRNIIAKEGLNTPVQLVNSEGNAFTNLSGIEVHLHITEKMESLARMPSGIERFFGISSRKRERIGDLILDMGLRQMQSLDYTVRPLGLAQVETFTKQQDRFGLVAGDKVEFVINGENHVATKSNKLAYEYANQLVNSDGYALKVYLDSYTAKELTTISTNIDVSWGSFRTDVRPSFHDAVTLLDAPLVSAMKENIDADIASGLLNFGASFNKFVNAGIASGDLVYDGSVGTIRHKDGEPHADSKVYAAYSDAMILIFNNYGDSMMSAVDNVYAGYAAAPDADKDLWLKDFKIIQAYRNGDIASVAGKYYELLERLPNYDSY